jgi:hypothetical protein
MMRLAQMVGLTQCSYVDRCRTLHCRGVKVILQNNGTSYMLAMTPTPGGFLVPTTPSMNRSGLH